MPQAILIYISLLFSCALSLSLNAQETFVMENIGTFSDPDSIRISKIDFFTGSSQPLFAIALDDFTHPNTNGQSNRITDFEFSSNREDVFFIEKEGDLYRYNILEESLYFLKDISPADPTLSAFDQLVANILKQVQNIQLINDSTLYIAGVLFGKYHLSSNIFETIIFPSDVSTSFTDAYLDMSCVSLVKHKGRYIYQSTSNKLRVLNLDNPELSYDLFDYENNFFFDALISYQFGCDSALLYRSNPVGTAQDWNIIDDVTFAQSYSHPMTISTHQGLHTNRYKHYNEEPWPGNCAVFVDLDEDDSTADTIDYLSPVSCEYTNLNIVDADLKIESDFPLDSLIVDILSPSVSQTINIPAGNYLIQGNQTNRAVLLNNGTTSNAEMELALMNAKYENTVQSGGNVNITFTAFYKTYSSDLAEATLQISNSFPDAGLDIQIDFCEEPEQLDLFELLATDIAQDGVFWDANFNITTNAIPLNQVGSIQMYYEIEHSVCADTASVIVNILAAPTLNPIGDQLICRGESLMVDLSSTGNDVQWSDGSTADIREFFDEGVYKYSLINSDGCMRSDSFELNILPAAEFVSQNELLCPGDSLIIGTTIYALPGTYDDTLKNSQGCDSLYTELKIENRTPELFEVIGDLDFCEGESIEIDISSDQEDLFLNNESINAPFLITDAGEYHLTGTDMNGCQSTMYFETTAHTAPQIILEEELEVDFQTNYNLPIDYVGQIAHYQWAPAEGLSCSACSHPTLVSRDHSYYTITVADENGCTATESINFRFKEAGYYVPTAIAKQPNDDRNGVFYLQSSASITYDLKVFNRWGGVEFEGKDLKSNALSEGWLPRENTNLGVYVYLIELVKNGQKVVLGGDVTVF